MTYLTEAKAKFIAESNNNFEKNVEVHTHQLLGRPYSPMVYLALPVIGSDIWWKVEVSENDEVIGIL